jgi:uncharacterized protein (DUF736 family)
MKGEKIMATKTANANKKEFKLTQVFAMWKRQSKNGNTFFSGKDEEGKKIRGFYNTKKQNPKEPDIRIYHVAEGGKLEKEVFVSLWCNAKDNGKKYLSGKIDGKRVVGFINTKATAENKQPYFSVYWSDANEDKKPAETEDKATKTTKAEKKEETETDNDLPF